MEYINFIDTSLDLNTIHPLQFLHQPPKQEVQTNFIDLGMNISVKEETGALLEELNRVNTENKKLTEMLTVACENYNALHNKMMEYIRNNPPLDTSTSNSASRKRKSESITNVNNKDYIVFNNKNVYDVQNTNSESSSSHEDSCKKATRTEHIKANISRSHVKTEASDNSLIVKDGYQWRKYGQKVTRDNPCPRAYFKCSFAPTCPVKKKVQRSADDQSIVVATYEGEHNHSQPSRIEATPSSKSGPPIGSSGLSSLHTSGPTATLDLTKRGPIKTKTNDVNKISNDKSRVVESPQFQQFLVDQMATSLTKDPSFKAALASAISGRFLKQS